MAHDVSSIASGPADGGGGGAKGDAAGGPLSAAQWDELAKGRVRARKIWRACSVAKVSGWMMALFAVMSAVPVLWGDWMAGVLALGFGFGAANELWGGAQLRRFDARGAARLAWNQAGIGSLIVLYSAWSVWSLMNSDEMKQLKAMSGDFATLGIDVNSLTQTLSWGVYGGLALVGVVVPGCTAWYYFSRGKLVRKMRRETPAWVIEMINVAG